MSMNYGIVKPSFWTGSTGRALRRDADAQVVALYLMTSPHANIIGVFRCPIAYVAAETGRTIEGASKGLTKLCQMGFCTVDAETETVWVHEMARFQIGDALKGADKRVKHVARFFAEIENPRIKWAFFEKYGTAFQLIEPSDPKPLASLFDAPSEEHQSPIEATVTVTVTNTVTDTVTVTPAPGGAETGCNPNPIVASKRSKPSIEGFDEFWALCPVKKSKAAAQKAWPRALATGATAAEIIAGMRRYALERAGQDPRYTKHPSTWLNAGCWADEPALPAMHHGQNGSRPNSGLTDFLLSKHTEQSQNDSVTIDLDDDQFARH